MKYRTDIDGLRAIAIALVLIYHGGLAVFPSGFVGVDVFFVISGFLITAIIQHSLATDDFSLLAFYNRRLWRLQPVFICLMAGTTILSLLLLLPEDLIEYSRSARKASLFISNMFFKHVTTGYASPAAHELPLLHTWSLSIEWQCYLILPVMMYCLHRFFSEKTLIRIVYVLTLMGLLLSFHYSNDIPAKTYYQFSSRMFEFLIGSCVALTPFNRYLVNRHMLNFLGITALITIFYIASLDHILLGYPNGYSFLVCLATGLLITLGTFHPLPKVIKVLSFRPLVFMGMLSYSLYIWHWVVFSGLRYQQVEETSLVLFMAYGITFVFAYLSWRYIEMPSSQLKQIKFRYTFVSLLLLPIFVIHTAAYFITENVGFPQRFNQELVTVYQQLAKYNRIQRPLCISNNKTDIETQCRLGSKNTNGRSALMIGDSFSNHYWGFMDVLGQDAHISILAQGTSSCITLPGIYLYNWWTFKNQVYQECHDQTEKYYQMIKDNHYDYVIIGQVWSNYLTDSVINNLGELRSSNLTKKRIAIALEKGLQTIVESGAQPVLVKSTALRQAHLYDCFFRHIKLRQPYDSAQCKFNLFLSDSEQWFENLFNKMQAKYPQLILIDPKTVQCPHKLCKADINGIPVYRDVGHITDYASYKFGEIYLHRFGNPFA